MSVSNKKVFHLPGCPHFIITLQVIDSPNFGVREHFIVWGPRFKLDQQTEMLEKVQWRATKLVPSLHSYPYKERLHMYVGLTIIVICTIGVEGVT